MKNNSSQHGRVCVLLRVGKDAAPAAGPAVRIRRLQLQQVVELDELELQVEAGVISLLVRCAGGTPFMPLRWRMQQSGCFRPYSRCTTGQTPIFWGGFSKDCSFSAAPNCVYVYQLIKYGSCKLIRHFSRLQKASLQA